MTSSLPVIVLGAGGHAKVVIDALLAAGAEIKGITDPDPEFAKSNYCRNVLLLDGDVAEARDDILIVANES